MSHKTAKTVTNKFLSTTKSDREGRRTVGSGRVATIIEKSGVAVFLFKNVKKWLMVKVLKFIDV